MRHLVASALFVAVFFPSLARADGQGVHEHDGFFLRVSAGAGSLSLRREGTLSAGSSSTYLGSSRISGGAGAFELSMGGALRPGIVLAATLTTQRLNNPTLKRDGEADVALEGPLTFLMLGASIDVYPDARGGFHFGGGLGFAGAWVLAPKPSFTEYLGGAGGAVSAHVGYTFWMAEQWSLGALLRVTGARVHGEDTQIGIKGSEDDNLGSVSLLATAVFN